MAPGKILELKNVSAGYDGHTVLKDVAFSVSEQDFVGIIGANGSGKTTLLKVILGLVRPLRGSVQFFSPGQEQTRVKPVIGYMPQYHV